MAFPPPRFRTDRLHARPAAPADAEAIFDAWASDPECTRWLGFATPGTWRDTEAFLKRAARAWETGEGHVSWILQHAGDGTLIGGLGATRSGHMVSAGYVVARAHWGQGYATEALIALCKAALAEPAIFRVWAVCDVDNAASARVMEKAGMLREGRLRRFGMHPNVSPDPRDVWCYARVR